MTRIRLFIAIVVALFVLTLVAHSSQASQPAPAPAVPQVGSTMFIENAGQFAEGARFQVRGGDRTIWLADDAIWITILGSSEPRPIADHPGPPDDPPAMPGLGVNLRLSFVGANLEPLLEPFAPLDTTISYFIGNDPDKWATAVPVWGGVRYVELYPGLDLELGDGGAMRLVCRAAGCQESLGQVQLQVDGAESLMLTGDGLVSATAAGNFSLPWLEVVDGEGRALVTGNSGPALEGASVMTPLVAPPHQQSFRPLLQNLSYLPIVMRPSALLYSTFLGGTEEEYHAKVAVDGAGRALVTGETFSSDFPTTPGAFDPIHNGHGDAYVVKVNNAGTSLLYATFLGGNSEEFYTDIAVDETGQAFVTGTTSSTSFPTTPGAFDQTFNGGSLDAFMFKLDATGSELLYSTYVGGNESDYGLGVTVNGAGQAHVTGRTLSSDFPTTPGAFDPTYNGIEDAFALKLNANGDGLIYSTFLGGSFPDAGHAMAVDSAGQAYVTGETLSSDFPTTPGSLDTTFNGPDGHTDAFAVKLDPTGSSLVYGTYLGGNGDDAGAGIVVDNAGQTLIAGGTLSSDFPTTPGSFDPTFNGPSNRGDGYLVKLNASGSGLVFGTFLGGSAEDVVFGLSVDVAGQSFLTGLTESSDFPITPDAIDTNVGWSDDAFVAKMNAAGSELLYGTFLGGNVSDLGWDVAVDSAGAAHVVGETRSLDFPTTPGAFDTSYNGSYEAFVVKLALGQ